jgi:hypothetical protein
MAKESAKQQPNEPVEASITTQEVEKPKTAKVRTVADKPPKTSIPSISVPPQLAISGKSQDVSYGRIKSKSTRRMTLHKKRQMGDDAPAMESDKVEVAEKPKRVRKPKAVKEETADAPKKASGTASAYRAFIKEHTAGGKMKLADAAKLWSSKKKE